jgi:tetratricopeptide (TPR) repeat protein
VTAERRWDGGVERPTVGATAAIDPRRRALFLGLALCLLTLAAYLPTLRNGFVDYDDRQYVTENPQVQAGLTLANLRWALTASVAANWHPLTLASHMLDCQLFGLNAKGHHLTSLVLHLAAVLVLFGLLRRATGSPLRSAAVAALFAVHPTHVESVAWVAERKDVLCGLFFLLSLGAYVAYARRRQASRFLLVAVFFVLALAAKPMAVTLPFVLLLFDDWPLARTEQGQSWRALVVEKLPLFGLSLLASLIALRTQAGALSGGVTAPHGLRIGNALTSYVAYLGKTFWPSGLAIFYPFPASVPPWKAAAAAGLLAAITTGAWSLRRRSPAVMVGWCWFLGTLVPVIGVLQVGMQGMADRYTYLPSIGLAIAVVWGIADLLWARLGQGARRVGAAGLLVVLAILVFVTRVQVGYWSDSMTLFTHSLNVVDSYLAHTNVAEGLRGRAELESDPRRAAALRAAALAHYRAALALEPRNPQALAAFGNALRAWGRPREAARYLVAALRLDPSDEPARVTLAMTDDDLGQPAAAIAELRRVLVDHPHSARAHYGLGSLLLNTGDAAGALREYRASLAADPTQRELYLPTAALWVRLGNPEAAVSLLRAGIANLEESKALHERLARMLDGLGRPAEAAAERRAARRVP